MKALNPQLRWDAEGFNEHIQRQSEWKVIAARDESANPSYIEFFTEPAIRFEVATADEFQKVRFTIERLGWRTIDLS